MRSSLLQSVALYRLRTGLGVALIAGSLGSGLAQSSCGVMSSDECAEKSTCPEIDAAIGGDPFGDVAVDQGAADGLVSRDGTLVDGPDARSDAPAEALGVDRPNPDTGHDVELPDTGDAGSDAGKDSATGDATVPEVDADAGTNPIPDAYEDVPSDAPTYTGGTDGCAPCTNVCAPSFVQCCTADGGCGCIEFFFPVLCL